MLSLLLNNENVNQWASKPIQKFGNDVALLHLDNIPNSLAGQRAYYNSCSHRRTVKTGDTLTNDGFSHEIARLAVWLAVPSSHNKCI